MKWIAYLLLTLVLLQGALAASVSINTYDPIPAEAGKYFNIWFTVETADEEEAEYFLEVQPKDGLELSPGQEAIQRVGLLKAFSTDDVQYRMFVRDDAVEGDNKLTVFLTEARSDDVVEKDLFVAVTEKDKQSVDLQVGLVASEPLQMKPDDENVQLDVTIQNLGDATAKSLSTQLINLPEGISPSQSYSDSSLIGNIDADSQENARFYIDIEKDVAPGSYEAQIEATYKYKPDEDEDDFVIKTELLPVVLEVYPTPLYEIVEVKFEPEELTAGDRPVFMTVTIKNIGEEEGESVRIKAYDKTEQPFTFDDSSDYIAPSLKPGEIGQGTLELKIEDDAVLKLYYVDLEIKNLVGNDVVVTQEKIPLEIKYPKPNSPWGIIIVGIIVLIIAGVVIMLRSRKAKKRTPHRFKRK